MKLIDEIDKKYKISIKEKDSNSINTLRLIKSSIKDKQISLRGKQEDLSDGDVLTILQNMVKERNLKDRHNVKQKSLPKNVAVGAVRR